MTNNLTVVLVTFNRTKYLIQAIDSVLNQTYKYFDFIILDNGSDIDTYNLIKPYFSKGVKYFRNEINNRENINRAFEIANTEYLVIAHDDDIMKPNFLEKEVAVLNKNKKICMVASNTEYINEFSNIIKTNSLRIKEDKEWSQYDYIKDYIKYGTIIPCPTVMYRRNVFIDNNLKFEFKVGPSADLFLWLNCNILDYKIYLINEPLYQYRIHSKQDGLISRISMSFEIYDHILNFLHENGFSMLLKHAENRFQKKIINSIIHCYYINIIDKKSFIKHLKKYKVKGYKYRNISCKSLVKLLIKYISSFIN